MTKPENFESFLDMLSNMEHRERLLFQTKDNLMLEIYFTIVKTGEDLNAKFNDNFNFKLYKDYNGKTEKIVLNKSRYKRLCDKSFLKAFYDSIAENTTPMTAKVVQKRYSANISKFNFAKM
jgi:hypothetical protein